MGVQAVGWAVQSRNALNLSASVGVAVREFTLEKPHGRVDYLPFVQGKPAGVIEAKPEGTTLTEVEHQSGKYVSGLPLAKISDTHQAVREWSKANGYQPAGPRWEIYGDPDPATGGFPVDVFWALTTP